MELKEIVFSRLQKQARHINNTFKNLGLAINAWLNGKTDELNDAITKIMESERNSTKVKNSALKDVANAISVYRSDFLRLVLKMDDCASFQGGAADRLKRLKFTPKSDDPMKGDLKNLIELFIKMGDTLSALMKQLGINMKQSLQFCEKIDLIEGEVDDAYRALESNLYSRDDLDIRIIMQLLEILKHVENSCDHVQSTSDSIRIILSSA